MHKSIRYTYAISILVGVASQALSLPSGENDLFDRADELNAKRIVLPSQSTKDHVPSLNNPEQVVAQEGSAAHLLELPSIPVTKLLASESKKPKSPALNAIALLPVKKSPVAADPVTDRTTIGKSQKPGPSEIDGRAFPESAVVSEFVEHGKVDEQRGLQELLAQIKPELLAEKWHAQQPRDLTVATTLNADLNQLADIPLAQAKSQPKREAVAQNTDCVTKPCLKLFQDRKQNHWVVEPQRLDISVKDEQIQVSIQGNDAPLLFVRDQGILNWDAEHRQLNVKASGETELYIVDDRKMLIVPIHVAASSRKNKDSPLKAPPADMVVEKSLLALKPLSGLGYAPKKPSTRLMSKARQQSVQVQAFGPDGRPLVDSAMKSQPSYGLLGVESQRKTLAIQLIDERSVVSEGKLYPVKDARVRILGSNWHGTTDIRGVLNLPDVPAGSRLIIQVDHPGGQIPLHSYEIYVDYEAGTQLERFTVMTYRSFFLYAQIFQVAQRTDLSSVCLALHSRDGAEALAGIQVALNGEADGPFYFNQFGPDPLGVETDQSGRFCLFNVDPGLTEISFYQDNKYLSSVAVPLLEGSHLDDEVFLWNGSALELRLAAMPTALEQLYSDFDRYMTFHKVDFVSMMTIGNNDELSSKESGVIEGQAGYSWYRGKIYLLAQAPEFESALFGVNDQALQATSGRVMAPLLPRGFVEDMFQELYLAESTMVEAFDSALGSVLALYGQSEEEQKQQPGPVKIRLINQFGVEAKEGWYFGSGADGLSKAIFFNLEPGIYSVIVESQDGVWLDFETVAVDFWTTSLVQTGHILGEIDP